VGAVPPAAPHSRMTIHRETVFTEQGPMPEGNSFPPPGKKGHFLRLVTARPVRARHPSCRVGVRALRARAEDIYSRL